MMHKKYISVFLTILIMLFSFKYTAKLIENSRMKNPIMLEIIEYSKTNDKIVNLEKSYNKMKKIKKFDKNLIVFNNDFDSFKQNDLVSLVIELSDNSYANDILNILKDKNISVTFFIKKELFDNNIGLVRTIIDSGNDIELLSDNYSVYEVNKYNSLIKLMSNDKLSFCLINNKNNINNCKKSNLIPVYSIDVEDSLYNLVKNKVEDKSIIRITNNIKNVKELSASINYLKQKGKTIVSLNKFYNK